jgi:tRNA(Met) cytidine acetyltransferase
VCVRALTYEGHVVSVALLAREGDLAAEIRSSMYEGERIRGNMIPDVLSTQLRDEAAGEPVGWRVMRIATHPAVRERGLGSRLLSEIEREADEHGAVGPTGEARPLDWLGVGYGATPELLAFWSDSGYRTVHVSTTRNERSGEHSAIMLRPLSAAGRELRERHTDWFHRRLTGMLSTPLSDLDPEVVLAVLGSLASPPPLELTDREWQLVAGSPFGAGLFEVSPEPFRRLALRGLADDDSPAIPERSRRVLVRACLQGGDWEVVAKIEGFHSRRECLRAFGDAVETLVEAYGPAVARSELERFR